MCTYTCFHICMCMGGPMCTQTLIPYSVILFSKTQSMLQVLWRNVQKIWAAFHTHTCMTYGRNVTKKFFDLALLLLILKKKKKRKKGYWRKLLFVYLKRYSPKTTSIPDVYGEVLRKTSEIFITALSYYVTCILLWSTVAEKEEICWLFDSRE